MPYVVIRKKLSTMIIVVPPYPNLSDIFNSELNPLSIDTYTAPNARVLEGEFVKNISVIRSSR